MMKPANLLSLVNAHKDLPQTVSDMYLKNFKAKIKSSELADLTSFVNQLQKIYEEIEAYEGYYIGYSISQINKEFDLLRIGENSIVNIELKRENTGEKIKKQLIKNRYYLSFLGKCIYSFTYVANEEKLYFIDSGEILNETDFSYLLNVLLGQELYDIDDIDKLFNPSNYLISPFNSTDAFMQGRYFLTEQQEKIKNLIMELSPNSSTCYISIEGSAGTGKSLLSYDIAKEHIKNSKKVAIFHCGKLNSGQVRLLSLYRWSIFSVKDLNSCDFTRYDLIIIDEVQRIYKSQLIDFFIKVNGIKIKCIFSYDYQQCLARWEIQNNIPQFIKESCSPNVYSLTEKIRTNKEIASFIKNLFYLDKINNNQDYSNIDVHYFSNVIDAIGYIKILTTQGWKAINYTPSSYVSYPYEAYHIVSEDNAHKVIGQEYDNVIAVIDSYFYYDQQGRLSTRGYKTNPYYHPTKMLFQIVTRARKKLSIIVINNEALLEQCLKIINRRGITEEG